MPNKAFSIAKMTITERKLDIFDCHSIDIGNRNVVLAIENEKLLKYCIHGSRLSDVTKPKVNFKFKDMGLLHLKDDILKDEMV